MAADVDRRDELEKLVPPGLMRISAKMNTEKHAQALQKLESVIQAKN